MPRKWSKYLSFVVLVSFVALLTPKSVWHDCHEHGTAAQLEQQHDQHSGKLVIQQGYEKCAVCDLHIPLLGTPLSTTRIAFTQTTIKTIGQPSVSPDRSYTSLHFLRGPPALMNS